MTSTSVDEPSRLAAPRGPRQLLRERRVSMLLRPRDETKVRCRAGKKERREREKKWESVDHRLGWSISNLVLLLLLLSEQDSQKKKKSTTTALCRHHRPSPLRRLPLPLLGLAGRLDQAMGDPRREGSRWRRRSCDGAAVVVCCCRLCLCLYRSSPRPFRLGLFLRLLRGARGLGDLPGDAAPAPPGLGLV